MPRVELCLKNVKEEDQEEDEWSNMLQIWLNSQKFSYAYLYYTLYSLNMFASEKNLQIKYR